MLRMGMHQIECPCAYRREVQVEGLAGHGVVFGRVVDLRPRWPTIVVP